MCFSPFLLSWYHLGAHRPRFLSPIWLLGVGNGGWYWGKVTRVIYDDPNEPIPYYRIHYPADGDVEDIALDDLLKWNKKAQEQGQKSAAPATTMDIDDDEELDKKKKKSTVRSAEAAPKTLNSKKTPPRRVSSSCSNDDLVLFIEGATVQDTGDDDDIMVTAKHDEYRHVLNEAHDKQEGNSSKSSYSYRQIDYGISNSLVQSLNSSSPHSATQFLTQMLLFGYGGQQQQHKRTVLIPGGELLHSLLDVAIHGPTSDNGTLYPDHSKLNHVMDYLRLLFNAVVQQPTDEHSDNNCTSMKNFLLQQVSEYRGSASNNNRNNGNNNNTQQYSLWQDFLNQISDEPYYVADGDYDKRTNMDALMRIGQSIHAKTCCAEVFAKLLELSQYKDDGTRDDNTNPILQNTYGAFDKAVAAYAKQWILLGHFANDMMELDETDQDQEAGWQLEECVSSLHNQSNALLNELGIVCSYFAQLYSIESNEGTMMELIAKRIKNIFYKQVQECQFQPSSLFLGQTLNKNYWLSIKLSFVLGFDKGNAPPGLRPALADALGVANSYNVCYGYL